MTDLIPITFDKSHLTTIGTRLYSESLDLIRELVANAYDADASWAKITLLEESLIVEDNGSGMDKEGLKQYFTIGSPLKRLQKLTPKYGRQLIGEFGIGKFAVLALCDRFELFTRKNGFAATVIFDKKDFQQKTDWQIPIIIHQGDYKRSGTRVTLINLKRKIGLEELERKLKSQLPLTEKNFAVFLNDLKLTPKYIPGRKFRLQKPTPFGTIVGEIIISSLGLPKEEIGIAIKVKGVTVKREFFGLENSHEIGAKRITGEVCADFLPLTAGRDNFLQDSPQYQAFQKALTKKAKEVTKELTKMKKRRLDQKANQALSDALLKVRQALKKNQDILFTHDLPLFSANTEKTSQLAKAVGSGIFSQRLSKKKRAQAKSAKLPGEISRQIPRQTRKRVKTVLKDTDRLVKRIRIGGTSLVCALTHLGEEEIESFVEGGVIFINRDHPLFLKTQKNEELASFYLTRLLTQEVALLANPQNAAKAFAWQSRLLTDALIEKK